MVLRSRDRVTLIHEPATPGSVPPEVPEWDIDQGVGDQADIGQAPPSALAAERLVLGGQRQRRLKGVRWPTGFIKLKISDSILVRVA